jgi:hypothetical protein
MCKIECKKDNLFDRKTYVGYNSTLKEGSLVTEDDLELSTTYDGNAGSNVFSFTPSNTNGYWAGPGSAVVAIDYVLTFPLRLSPQIY